MIYWTLHILWWKLMNGREKHIKLVPCFPSKSKFTVQLLVITLSYRIPNIQYLTVLHPKLSTFLYTSLATDVNQRQWINSSSSSHFKFMTLSWMSLREYHIISTSPAPFTGQCQKSHLLKTFSTPFIGIHWCHFLFDQMLFVVFFKRNSWVGNRSLHLWNYICKKCKYIVNFALCKKHLMLCWNIY